MKSNNEFSKKCIKNHRCYYFDDIINIKYVDLNNILLDEKIHQNILMYVLFLIKLMDMLENLIELNF